MRLPSMPPSVPLFALVLGLVSPLRGQERALTLSSRSNGLETPTKEGGSTEFELADLNGDGNLDLVGVGDHGSPNVNSAQHGIMVWLGDGAGNWAVNQTGNFGYGGCAAGDLNGDGLMDLAWGVHHDWATSGLGTRLMGAALGDGTGSGWTPWDSGLATSGETYGMFATDLADFDGDGRLDVVSLSFGCCNGLSVYANHGDGTWSPAWTSSGGNAGFNVEACDVDADGFLDIVSARAGTPVWRGDGAFGFVEAKDGLPASAYGADAGDVLGDGRDEIAFPLGGGLACFRFDDASQSWISISSGLPASGGYVRAQLGDVSGDGNLDIVSYRGRTGEVWLGDGRGNWTADATWTMPGPGSLSALRVDGDMDHDGREDIVVSAEQAGFPFSRNQLRVYSAYRAPESLGARVTRPRGGELFRSGSLREVRWVSAVPPAAGPATVELQLSQSGPSGPWTTIGAGLPDNGRFDWVIPQANSTTCRLRAILTTTSGSFTAASAADFRILGNPALTASAASLPATGGTVQLDLAAGAAHAGRTYLLAGGVTGTSPGTPLPGGLTIPVNQDPFTTLVLALANTPLFPGFAGTLNGAGEATAAIIAPAVPALVGVTMHYAFTTTNPYDFVSNAAAVTVVP